MTTRGSRVRRRIARCLTVAWLSASVAASAPQIPQPADGAQRIPQGRRGGGPPASGTAVMRGRVVAVNGQPLRGATVEAGPAGVPSQLTGEDGRFAFTGLPAGRYSISVSKGAFVSAGGGTQYGAARIPALRFDLADGETLELADIVLTRGGVVAGSVMDERGNSISAAIVSASRWGWSQGRRRLQTAGADARDRTDDRGQFRIFGLPPGSYLLAVETESPFGPGRVTAYYPAAYSPSESQAIVVESRATVSGLVVTLASAPTAAISGIARTPEGQPLTAASVNARLVGTAGTAFQQSGLGPGGSFRLEGLPPGDYVVSTTVDLSGSRLSGAAVVTVDGADVVVPLTLRRPSSLRGRYVFDTGTPPPDLRPPAPATAVFALDPATEAVSSSASWMVAPDWTFEVSGLYGRYQLRPPAPQGWHVREMRLGNTDVTDSPFEVGGGHVDGLEVVLTQQATRVTGTVTGVDGQPAASAAVVLFAENESKLWPATRYLARVEADRNGRFTIAGLPPARYLAVAVPYLDAGEEGNPDQLRRFRPVATTVSLDDGQAQTLDLRVTGLP